MRVWIATLLMSAPTLAIPASAQEPADPVLRWSAPGTCPREALVREALTRRLGRSPEAVVTQVRAEARVREIEGGYALELAVRSGASEGTRRRLRSRNCAELAEAVALSLALAIDPDADTRTPTPSAVARSAPEDASEPPAAATDANGDTAPTVGDAGPDVSAPTQTRLVGTPVRLTAVARLGALFDTGTLPSLALGPQLAGGIAIGSFEVLLQGFYLPPHDVAGTARDGTVGSLRMAAAGPAVCARLGAGPWRWWPCMEGAYGRVWGSGEGITETRDASARWLELGAGLRAELTLTSWLAAGARLGAALPLIRTAFRVEGHGEVHRPDALSARLSLDLTLRP